ncbi:MAG: hypothetical protein COV69_04090 [Parcubacteria group bacterium CG11_big_fil_rev_8_21_14_0_20_39_14]|nr:MAG: hypothetical protein COV69_04090 [Parcubacteria group bacterium CG11_big_fil_rev_8_21_14_0_20_39_14]
MVPSKRSLGSIIFLPGDGFRLPTKESLLAEIEFRLAGKITEEIIYGKKGVSTLGALDLNHVVGMLTINKIIVGSKGRGAEDTAKIIENIIKECENKVRETLMSQRDKLERLAQVILEKQDISIKEIDALGIF